jgi:hypothetical protein
MGGITGDASGAVREISKTVDSINQQAVFEPVSNSG